MSEAFDVRTLEQQLANLWHETSQGQPTTRACMSNLMIYCESLADLEQAAEHANEIVQRHPSRVLLLHADEAASNARLDGNVTALCHLTGPDRKHCSECITLEAHGSDVQGLPALVRPLLIGDLPTSLWWTPSGEAPARSGELFHALAAMADQVVYDSRGWRSPARDVVDMADWVAGAKQRVICDLAWRRLMPWRRLLGQTLDPALAPCVLSSIEEIHVEHGPHALPKAWLLIGWLASRLGWKPNHGKVRSGEELAWGFDSDHGPIQINVKRQPEGEPEIRKLEVHCNIDGRPRIETFCQMGSERLALMSDNGSKPRSVLVALRQSRSALVADQLPDLGRDRVFRSTLDVARIMAEPMLRP